MRCLRMEFSFFRTSICEWNFCLSMSASDIPVLKSSSSISSSTDTSRIFAIFHRRVFTSMVFPFSSFLKELFEMPSNWAIFSCEIPFLRLISQIFSFMELLFFIIAKILPLREQCAQLKVVKIIRMRGYLYWCIVF